MENKANHVDDAFDPDFYPRSYGTQMLYRSYAGFIAISFFLFACIGVFGLPHVHGGERIGAFFVLVFLLIFAITQARTAFFPPQMELTATSLTINSRFSKTRCIRREDIASCELCLGGKAGKYVVIKHRDPKAKPIIARNLDWDAAFWGWFSEIPGERRNFR